MMLKKLFSHSLIYSLAPQAPKIASLLLLPITTKHLTAADFGIYGVITSYLFFLSAAKDMGFGVVYVNTFYKHPHRWRIVWRMLHGHLILWSLIYAVLLLALLWVAMPSGTMHRFGEIALLVTIPALLFDNTNSIASYYFRFSQKPMFIATVSVITGVTAVVVTYYCIVTLGLGYMSWFIATFASSMLMFLLYAYPVYGKLKLWPIIRFRKKFILPHLKVALPMVPHNYSSYLLNSSDRVVMDLYKVKTNDIGVYNIAYTFGNYFETFGEAVGMATGPFFSKLYTSKHERAHNDQRNLTFFLMSIFLATAFLVSVWMKEIFLLLLNNPDLESAYPIGILIIMGYAYRPMYWSAGIKLSIFEKTSLLWKISLVGGLVNIVLNVIFVPFFGIYAAAISTLLSLLYIGFSGYYFKSYKKLPGLNHYPAYWLCAILVLTGCAYLLKDVPVIYKIALTVLAFASGWYLFRKFYPVLRAIDV